MEEVHVDHANNDAPTLPSPSFTVPPDTMTPHEIMWHNITTADKHHNLSLFIGGCMAWLKLNPGKNYQNLEDELRARKLYTHLIAAPPKVTGMHLKLPYDKDMSDITGEPCAYECIMSCRPPPHAMNELLQHASSYEENWARLKFAGSLIAIPDELPDMLQHNKNLQILSDDDASTLKMIAFNQILVSIDNISCEEFIKRVGIKYPGMNLSVLGMTTDGPLVALTLQKEIGMCIYFLIFFIVYFFT